MKKSRIEEKDRIDERKKKEKNWMVNEKERLEDKRIGMLGKERKKGENVWMKDNIWMMDEWNICINEEGMFKEKIDDEYINIEIVRKNKEKK